MKKNNTKSSVIKPLKYSVLAAIVLSAAGIYLHKTLNTRLYRAAINKEADKNDDGREALGMEQYFFNARKNNVTGKMDYAAMAKAELALQNYNNSHRATAGGLGLNWSSMGPTNVGGRTRAILFDKNDPSGNTMFAASVSGGIWKSTDAGASWSPVNDNLLSLEACCLAQDANGNIYCGTGEGFSLYSGGEGFSTAMLGGGIFKSTDDGATFQVLPSTIPTRTNDSINNVGGAWSYVNRIAIPPCNPNIIYAATNAGLYISNDAGTTWHKAKKSTSPSIPIGGNALDVKISNDGQIVVASINGFGYYQNPGSCGTFDTTFSQMRTTGADKIGNGDRIEFAISPTNSQYIYASVAYNGGALQGIYMTMDMGNHWHLVGPGGSPSFDPFTVGSGDQGDYDNTVAVFPTNPGEILLGGTTFWFWKQNSPNDTVGSWQTITAYGQIIGGPGVHPDEHAIAFDPANPNIVYIGCDGGIFQTLNINTLNTEPQPNNLPNWNPMNRNYVTTQFFNIAFGPWDQQGSQNGVPLLGGTQDNGSPFIPGTVTNYPQDQLVDASGGDGGGCALSYIDPHVGFSSVHYENALLRITDAPSFASFLTTTGGIGKGANIDSMSILAAAVNGAIGQPSTCFVPPLALYENMYDKNTIDTIQWIADSNYQAGHVVYPISPNGLVPITYTLPKSMSKGDTIRIQNIVVSKCATAFNGTYGVWMNMQAVDLSDPVVWMPIGGPLSKPVPDNDQYPVHSLAWSPDGDALLAGSEDGKLFRFSNLNQIRDSSYLNGALWSEGGSGNSVTNPLCRVISYNVDTANSFKGRDILSITFNPRDKNDAIVTLGNYNNTKYIFYSNNVLSVHHLPTWTSKQGISSTALPLMPVYTASYAFEDGNPDSASVVVGTEHGVWSTPNITVANPVWSRDNNGAPNTLVLGIKQQNTPTWLCSNSGNIYMGTHGRGIWSSNTLGPLSVPQVNAPAGSDLKVYPNPMNTNGTVDFALAKADNLTLTVYDIMGREVENMHLGTQATGEHLIPLNTSAYSAGTYIVSVTGNTYHKTGRFVVVK